MKFIQLRRTWYEIADAWYARPNPLHVATVINRFSPRSWRFALTFDGAGQLTLTVSPSRPVDDAETPRFLDGLIEEVFFAQTVTLRQRSTQYTADTASLIWDPKPDNTLQLLDVELTEGAPLVLQGFWRSRPTPPIMQDEHAIRAYLLENTWLGSAGFADTKHVVRWVVFGATYVVGPTSRYAHRLSVPSHTSRVELVNAGGDHIGTAIFHTSDTTKETCIYSEFGPLDVVFPQKEAPRSRRSWLIEAQASRLREAIILGQPTASLVVELGVALEGALADVLNSEDYITYDKALRYRSEVAAVNQLKARQERARRSDRVWVGDEAIMLEPSNENEVLALVCKLEVAKALPFVSFRLWEYTAKRGIDAIASYQVLETDVPSQYATVEVEFHYENFFDHGHPPRQVNLIVCWDFRDGQPVLGVERRHELGDGFFEYKEAGWTCLVLVLAQISTIQIGGCDQ